MKVPVAYTRGDKTVVEDTELNFGRVMRVTLYYGNTSVVLEFAPQKDPSFTPRMEATVNDIAQPNQVSGNPGFTAEVKLYNAAPAVKTLLASHQQFVLDFTKGNDTGLAQAAQGGGQSKELVAYYNSRPKIKVECGYWQPNKTKLPGKGKFAEGFRTTGGICDYHLLFQGHINSTLEYMQGTDVITHLYCHDFDEGQISNKAILESLGQKYTPAEGVKWQELSQAERDKRSGRTARNWHDLASRLCRLFIETRNSRHYTPDSEQTFLREPVTEEDRLKHDWFGIKYIYTPSRKDEFNAELEKRMSLPNTVDVTNFMTNAPNFRGIFSDLCNYANADVNYLIDYEYDPSRVVIFVYPRGNTFDIKTRNTEDSTIIKIVNYQNLIGNPAVSSSGQLTVKMLLNWECIPLRNIELVLDKKIGAASTTGEDLVVQAGSGTREVIAAGGKISPYAATQYGAYNSAVYTLQYQSEFEKNHGYMFNTPFPMIKVKHEVSTHGKEWYTTVTTVPKYTGIKL